MRVKHVARMVLTRNACKFELEKLTERNHLGDIGVDRMEILK